MSETSNRPASRIDLARVRKVKGERTRAALLVMAQEAQKSERFLDMFDICCDLIKNAAGLPALADVLEETERRCIAVAFKNVTSQLRAAWEVIEVGAEEPHAECLRDYKNHIMQQLVEHCQECRSVLNKLNSPTCDLNPETEVFVLKMIADYHRYSAETAPHSKHVTEAAKYYEQGTEAAEKLDATNPVRIGLALNFAVFHFEIEHDAKAAASVAKNAFSQAIAKLDHIDEKHYNDTTLIMQLLRDNINHWGESEEAKS